MYDFAQNKTKLQRILDKNPQATVEEIKAEYIKQGGLLNIQEEVTVPVETPKPIKKTTAKKVKEAVTKAVKKVTKKK